MTVLLPADRRADEQPDDERGSDRLEHGPAEDVLGAPRDGTDDSFEAVFFRHWQTVYAVLYRLVGTREEAEDLAQEVFLRLYLKPLPTERANNVGGWLYRVATNLGYNALRSSRRRLGREAQTAADLPVSRSPLEQTIASEEREEVRRALADLSERQQACLVLRHQGFTYARIADSLGVSPNSVGTILVRAENEFRRRYLERTGGL